MFFLLRLVFFLLASLLISRAMAAIELLDDTHQVVYLAKPAQRIISLAPDITEILFAIGAENKIVGVISGCDYPAAAKKLPQVGSYTGIDLERIMSLKPDLIITWGNMFFRQLLALKQLGVAVYVTEPHRIEDIAHTMKQLGVLTAMQKRADKTAQQFSEQLLFVKNRYQHKNPVRVFFQIGSHSLITINKNSWINQAISLCGGENVFADSLTAAPAVSVEALVLANPEVIISATDQIHWRDRFLPWHEITAVNKQLLFAVDPDVLERAGPRILEGVSLLCAQLEKARVIYTKGNAK